MDEPHLFDVQPYIRPASPLTSPSDTNGVGTSAMGSVAEMLLIAELLKRGHKVALPVVDDDGVDLVVNYRIAVQVKSKGFRNPGGAISILVRDHRDKSRRRDRLKKGLRPHVDILAVYATDVATWWHIPRAEVQTNKIKFYESSRSRFNRWREAWSVYEVEDLTL
jgi:PD-(D/E)XK endonuclease